MKEIFLSVRTRDGWSDIFVEPTGVEGIVVHRTLGSRSGWTLTHSPSGYRIPLYFASKRTALLCARKELAPLGNWARGYRAVCRDRRVKAGVKAIRDAKQAKRKIA